MAETTIKEKVLKAIEGLPQDSTFEDTFERLYLLYKVEKGIKQADSGLKISHEEAKVRMKKWLS